MLRSREEVDGVQGGKVNSGKAAGGGRESRRNPLSPAPETWYFRCCHFPALGREEGKA